MQICMITVTSLKCVTLYSYTISLVRCSNKAVYLTMLTGNEQDKVLAAALSWYFDLVIITQASLGHNSIYL